MRLRSLAALLLLATPVAAAAPGLKALTGWRPGLWQAQAGDGHAAAPACLAGPESMLLGGRADAGCSFTVIADTDQSAVVTYRCADGRQGRTEVRRDTADIYTVDAQGLEGGRPFAGRSEWRRLKGC